MAEYSHKPLNCEGCHGPLTIHVQDGEKIADAALTGLLGSAASDLAQFQSEAQAIAAECGAWSHQMSFEASER